MRLRLAEARELIRRILHRYGSHDYSTVTTYFGGREERSCVYCGKASR